MLGPNKWRLLTIVAGLFLANAIDSPVRSAPNILSRTSVASDSGLTQIGIKLEKYTPLWNGQKSSAARNLYRPYQKFSNVDNVRFVDKRYQNERIARQAFGSFRYPQNGGDMKRRSDNGNNGNVSDTTLTSVKQKPQKSVYAYIPLGIIDDRQLAENVTVVNTTPSPAFTDKIQSRTGQTTFTFEDVSTVRSKITFPGSTAAPHISHDITGRRSGIQFTAQSQKIENQFQPQGYREDNPNSPHYQFPYSEELSEYNPETRYARGIVFDQQQRPQSLQQQKLQPASNAKVQFRDDVTKFGDINGPITAMAPQPRQYNSDYSDTPYVRPYDNGYYYPDDQYSRSPRHYFPPKAYVEYSDYPGPPRSRLITPWKSSRTPRVVFPQADSFPSAPGAASTAASGIGVSSSSAAGVASLYNSDNVVFRYVQILYLNCLEILLNSSL